MILYLISQKAWNNFTEVSYNEIITKPLYRGLSKALEDELKSNLMQSKHYFGILGLFFAFAWHACCCFEHVVFRSFALAEIAEAFAIAICRVIQLFQGYQGAHCNIDRFVTYLNACPVYCSAIYFVSSIVFLDNWPENNFSTITC